MSNTTEHTTIDGQLFRSMVIEGALAIRDKKEQANELNVFPVPDGDTGTNMSLTMAAAMDEMAKLDAPPLSKAVDTTASALLRGARGNSGVILSLLFRGLAKKLREKEQADGRDLAIALREGVDTAYKAVMKPAEGTILTVSRVAAQYALEKCQADPALPVAAVLDAVLLAPVPPATLSTMPRLRLSPFVRTLFTISVLSASHLISAFMTPRLPDLPTETSFKAEPLRPSASPKSNIPLTSSQSERSVLIAPSTLLKSTVSPIPLAMFWTMGHQSSPVKLSVTFGR